MSSTFRASVTARLLAIRQRNVCARGPAATIALARLELAQRHYRRTLQRQAEKDARRELSVLGRLVSTPI